MKFRVFNMQGVDNSIINTVEELMPYDYNRLIDGTAGTFEFLYRHPGKSRIAIDRNPHVVNTHKCVRDEHVQLFYKLERHDINYNSLTHTKDQQKYYQSLVDCFNSPGFSTLSATDQAATFITLTKLSFNSLVRLNSKGKWNVSFGNKRNVSICNQALIWQANLMMRSVVLKQGGYRRVLDVAREDDLVVINTTFEAGKKKLYECSVRLAAICKFLNKRRAKWLLVVPDTDSNRKQFFDYHITQLVAPSRISATVSGRKARHLLAITNYIPGTC